MIVNPDSISPITRVISEYDPRIIGHPFSFKITGNQSLLLAKAIVDTTKQCLDASVFATMGILGPRPVPDAPSPSERSGEDLTTK